MVSEPNAVDDLIAEIRRAGDVETVARLQGYLTHGVFARWKAIVRETGERLGWEPIAEDVERISRAAEERCAEIRKRGES